MLGSLNLHSQFLTYIQLPSSTNMLLRRARLPIPKPGPIKPTRTPSTDMVPSLASPLERNPQSPKGWKKRESDGVGLGIVAALGKSDGRKGPEKISIGAPTVMFVTAPININGFGGGGLRCESWRCCDGDQDSGCGFFCVTPPSLREGFRAFRPADFLSYCYLCRKRLDGEDIFMYRGEKAFCSMECRYQQIVSDEFNEKCGSESFRLSSEHTTSRSLTDDHRLFFTTGIAAA